MLELAPREGWRPAAIPRSLIEHVAALGAFTALAVALSWPLVTHFTTHIHPGNDPRHNLWVIWHVREWLAGRQPLFDLPLLYYPSRCTPVGTACALSTPLARFTLSLSTLRAAIPAA
jgi:hypothetical protein